MAGVLLGKITEYGFLPSGKNKLRDVHISNDVDIKNYGLFKLFLTLQQDEFDSLKAFYFARCL